MLTRSELVCFPLLYLVRFPTSIYPVWLACTLSFILGLPSLGSSVAFAAATSIATIGLYISYGKLLVLLSNSLDFTLAIAIPIALRVVYRKRFTRGPFHLGIFSIPIAVAAVTWIAFIAIVFLLPQANVRAGIAASSDSFDLRVSLWTLRH